MVIMVWLNIFFLQFRLKLINKITIFAFIINPKNRQNEKIFKFGNDTNGNIRVLRER